jgi:hypothetical protein
MAGTSAGSGGTERHPGFFNRLCVRAIIRRGMNTIIYYDMEGYDPSCELAGNSFLSGWDEVLEGNARWAGPMARRTIRRCPI